MSATETFIEYGVSYRGQSPRRGSWTPDFEQALQAAAWHSHVLGDDTSLDPIVVMQRTTTITSDEWRPGVRPAVEDEALAHAPTQTAVAE